MICLKCAGHNAPSTYLHNLQRVPSGEYVFSIAMEQQIKAKNKLFEVRCQKTKIQHLHVEPAQRDALKNAMGAQIGTSHPFFELYESALHQSKLKVL